MEQALTVEWIDSGREPRCPPNPGFPAGIDIDVSDGKASCQVALPYPAKRCGSYIVKCRLCGYAAACTTAGRPDDPRSIKIPCQLTSA